MKRIFAATVVLMLTLSLLGQGSLKLLPGASLVTRDAAQVVLNNMNLKNDGTIQQSSNNGTFIFRGSTNDSIAGNGITIFDRLKLAKDAGKMLVLQRNIRVDSEFVFSGGMLNLDRYNMDLGTKGLMLNESENSRAFTTDIGYIRASRVLNNPSAINAGNLGAIITSKDNMGLTIIKRGHKVQPNVSGANPSIRRYYDITPANNISLKATLRFQYFDAELNGRNENLLQQWKTKDINTWENVGADSRSVTLNYVLRNNISKFSRLTLSGPAAVSSRSNLITATADEEKSHKLSITPMPNPAGHYFTCITRGSVDNSVLVRITDNAGRIIELKPGMPANNTFMIGHTYSAGVYYAELVQGNEKVVIKLIKL